MLTLHEVGLFISMQIGPVLVCQVLVVEPCSFLQLSRYRLHLHMKTAK